jgi:hypothetical protein
VQSSDHARNSEDLKVVRKLKQWFSILRILCMRIIWGEITNPDNPGHNPNQSSQNLWRQYSDIASFKAAYGDFSVQAMRTTVFRGDRCNLHTRVINLLALSPAPYHSSDPTQVAV